MKPDLLHAELREGRIRDGRLVVAFVVEAALADPRRVRILRPGDRIGQVATARNALDVPGLPIGAAALGGVGEQRPVAAERRIARLEPTRLSRAYWGRRRAASGRSRSRRCRAAIGSAVRYYGRRTSAVPRGTAPKRGDSRTAGDSVRRAPRGPGSRRGNGASARSRREPTRPSAARRSTRASGTGRRPSSRNRCR